MLDPCTRPRMTARCMPPASECLNMCVWVCTCMSVRMQACVSAYVITCVNVHACEPVRRYMRDFVGACLWVRTCAFLPN